MPFYEYECEACGHRLEVLQKISEPKLTDCPECKAPQLKKLISAAGFRLKGGGWYETDFKNTNKPKDKANKSDAKPTDDAKTDSTKTDSSGAGSKPANPPATAANTE